jgi:hypothetical protein
MGCTMIETYLLVAMWNKRQSNVIYSRRGGINKKTYIVYKE